MTRHRFTLAQSMALVIYLGFGFAALRNADPFWAGATYTLASITIAAAPLGAFARRGTARLNWAGFAVFGWTSLFLTHLPPWRIGGVSFGPIDKPVLLIDWGFARLRPYFLPPTASLRAYEQVSLSLGVVLFGLVGAVVGRFVAVKESGRVPSAMPTGGTMITGNA
jgi:hypothetical protein